MWWRLFMPGLRFKRYLGAVGLGFLLLGADAAHLWWPPAAGRGWTAALTAAAGALLVGWGSRRVWASLTDAVGSARWTGRIYTRYLARGPKVAALGGGTGLPAVLRGLKEYTANLTAVVTVADDGGSSGRLRGELGMLPPGDIRNCLVALADTEPLMEDLFQFRFSGGDLAGHSFGNLFLAAMEQTRGDFVTGLKEVSRVLAVRGSVLPVTLEHVTLKARLADGSEITGESRVGRSPLPIERVWLEPSDATPLAEAVAAIAEADLVVLGPGSLYTSVLPNLLVGQIRDAIRTSRALRVYVANIMTQPGETSRYTAWDHWQALSRHVGPGLVDVILVNNAPIDPETLARYRKEGADVVTLGDDPGGPRPIVVQEPLVAVTPDGTVRHDPHKLARALLRLLLRYRPDWAERRVFDALWLENRLKDPSGWPGGRHGPTRAS
ncbi:MAG: YvcK family protein [Firmicutes bacterium]|nr:YvcK family protein [Bacillota bacterium]